MKIENIDISHVYPYKLNAKLHPLEQVDGIAESIKRFGFVQPLVVDASGCIVIGHGRYAAAKKIGLKEVPCVRIEDLDDQQLRGLRLLDNKIAETGWDIPKLGEEFGDLSFDFETFNVDFSSEISANFNDNEKKKTKEEKETECPSCGLKF